MVAVTCNFDRIENLHSPSLVVINEQHKYTM